MTETKTRQLLVIEDDPGVVGLLRQILGPQKWEIDAALTLAAAVKTLSLNRYDAVLLDLGLPDSPREATIGKLQWIKNLTRFARLVVITGLVPVPEAEALGLVVLEKGAEGIMSRLLDAIGGGADSP